MLSTHLPIFSTHLPTSRRKLSRPTAVGRCVRKFGPTVGLIPPINADSNGVCWFFLHNTTVGGTLANKKARRDHMTDLQRLFSFSSQVDPQNFIFIFCFHILLTWRITNILERGKLVIVHHRFISLIYKYGAINKRNFCMISFPASDRNRHFVLRKTLLLVAPLPGASITLKST